MWTFFQRLTGLSQGHSIGSQQFMMTDGPKEEGRETNQRPITKLHVWDVCSRISCQALRARAVAVEGTHYRTCFVGLFIRCLQLECTQVKDYEQVLSQA